MTAASTVRVQRRSGLEGANPRASAEEPAGAFSWTSTRTPSGPAVRLRKECCCATSGHGKLYGHLAAAWAHRYDHELPSQLACQIEPAPTVGLGVVGETRAQDEARSAIKNGEDRIAPRPCERHLSGSGSVLHHVRQQLGDHHCAQVHRCVVFGVAAEVTHDLVSEPTDGPGLDQ